MTPDPYVAIGTIALAVIAVISLLIAVYTAIILRNTQREARNAKLVETMSSCMNSYQQLEGELHARRLDDRRYYELLWNLHFAEYHFYRLGFIRKDVYVLWLWVRHQMYHGTPVAGLTMSQADGWIHGKKYLSDPDFARFVESWLLTPGVDKAYIEKQLPPVELCSLL